MLRGNANGTLSRRAPLALVLAFAAFVLAIALAPLTAQALTTNKATARPNEDGGSGVIGGIDTRLTWEGTVDEGEEVNAVRLELPAGGSFDGATTRITVLDGLTRIPTEGTTSPEGEQLVVEFAEPIAAGSLLRLEVEGMRFPSEGGEVAVGGVYIDGTGAEHELAPSKPIVTIANTWLQQAVAALDANPAVQAWNSNQFLGMFFKPQLMLTSLVSLFPGWLVCLGLVLVADPVAVARGLMCALMKISRNPLLRAVAIVYINILRGTPLFLQIYIMFFGLPMLGINIDNNILGVAVMAINSSAYLAEIFRAGIESIPQGQYEAAASLGMGRLQTMFTIILPQTIRRVIPTVTSDFITSYKDTSLLSSVGVMELMMFAKNATSVSGNITPYVTAAIFYLIITLPLIKVVGIIEKRIARSERGGGVHHRPTKRRGERAADIIGDDSALDAPVGGSRFQALDLLKAPLAGAPMPALEGGAGDVR